MELCIAEKRKAIECANPQCPLSRFGNHFHVWRWQAVFDAEATKRAVLKSAQAGSGADPHAARAVFENRRNGSFRHSMFRAPALNMAVGRITKQTAVVVGSDPQRAIASFMHCQHEI